MTDLSSLVIGVDCSTTAAKAVVWDSSGNAVAQGYSPLPLLTPQPGWHEQPADSWWTTTAQALRQAVSQVDARRLRAFPSPHSRRPLVPVDAQGQPLTHGILWLDERARDLLPSLAESGDPAAFHRLTGKPLSVNLTFAKIAWLQIHRPDVFARAARYLDVHSFLVHRLTGQYRTGWGCADPTGLFDLQINEWAAPLLHQIGLRPEQLPELFPPGAVLGVVTPAAAEACGLPVGLPVAAGLGDGQAGGLGVNVTGPGAAYLSLGTSVISGTYSARPVCHPAFRTMTGGIPATYLLETVLLGGGYTLAWFMEKFAGRPGQDVAQLRSDYDRAAAALPPGSAGLIAVPYWNSVLGPYWDAAASGIVVGWRERHQPAHLYRAILEGIAFEQHLNTLGVEAALSQPVTHYIALGGGAHSRLWLQIIADVTGKPVACAAAPEAAALGAGILAATAAGLYPDARQAAQAMAHHLPDPVEPDAARHTFYAHLFEDVYRPLFPALQPYLDRLAALADFTP